MDFKAIKRRYVGQVLMVSLILAAFCISSGIGVAAALADDGEGSPSAAPAAVQRPGSAATRWDLAMAIAVAISIPCVAAGYAVGKVGAAALGAASEKPELLTRSLLFVALAEGIAIYGLLVSVLLYLKL
ncbi:MAG: hypothetical protein KAX44_04200 [Candidatus Brocadiae bacterium]|nr:hypothetical protein [Candidatus Brocadiia bacterium]